AIEQLARVVAIEDGDARPIDKIVVGAVIDEEDAVGRENRRGGWVDGRWIEFFRTTRANWCFCCFRPVSQGLFSRESHLVGLVFSSAEPVHPIFTINFLGEDSA